jgi:heme-degrading monooxygenase HmoA
MRQLIVMRVHVAPGREAEFERFVDERAGAHRSEAGFDRMYLLREANTDGYRIVTWWRALPDPESWVRKETYAYSESPAHPGIIVGPVPFEVLEIVKQYEASPPAVARAGNA